MSPVPCRTLAQTRRRKKAFLSLSIALPPFIIIYCYLPPSAICSVLFLILPTCLARRLTPFQFASSSRLLIRASRLAIHQPTGAAKRPRLRRPASYHQRHFLKPVLQTQHSSATAHRASPSHSHPAGSRSRLLTFQPLVHLRCFQPRRVLVFNSANPVHSDPAPVFSIEPSLLPGCSPPTPTVKVTVTAERLRQRPPAKGRRVGVRRRSASIAISLPYSLLGLTQLFLGHPPPMRH